MKYYTLLNENGYTESNCLLKVGNQYPDTYKVWKGDTSDVAEQVSEFPEDFKEVHSVEFDEKLYTTFYYTVVYLVGIPIYMIVCAAGFQWIGIVLLLALQFCIMTIFKKHF
jgi:hypothetical protein